MFDEFFSPPARIDSPVPVEETPAPVESTDSPSSTTVDQDTPSPKESHDLEVAHMSNNPYFGIPIPETIYAESSSLDVISTTMHSDAPISEHLIEPKMYKDALTQSYWYEAMQEELYEFERLKVWELFSRPDKVMDKGIDFEVSLCYRGRLEAVWIFLAFAAHMNMIVYQMDVKTTFLNGILREEAPRAWYDLLSSFLLSQGFSKGTVDPTLFISRIGKDILQVQIYVDDIIFASTTTELCNKFSEIICSKFKMSMMGKITFFLGLQILQSPRGIFLNQSKYALKSHKKYIMESCDPVDTPMVDKSKLNEDTQGKAVDPTHYRGMVDTLMYLTSNRLDLVYDVCICARYQARPTEKYLHDVKRIFQYLRGTVNQGLWYSKDSAIALTTFVDAYHAGCQDTRRSTSGILWMRSQLTDYGIGFNKIPMYCDNKSAIALCCNNVQHSRSKHIDNRYHFIKEQVENEVVELYFVRIEYQLADIFTKALCQERIKFLIDKLGIRIFTPETLKELADEAVE
ncbi:retrovirus-related pol polyprotein from transposon TNT 1-94 [Tanacetum coccineum]